MLTKTVLYEARTGGYHNYRIPGMLCTPGGVILASAEARRGQGGDWDGSDLLLRRSMDGGRTWHAPRCIVSQDDFGRGPLSDCVMMADTVEGPNTGTVHCLFSHDKSRMYTMRSMDDGETFSAPREITPVLREFHRQYAWRVIVAGPGHSIQLQSGRLLAPVWMSDGSSGEFPGHLGHRPSVVATIYSDDGGERWQCGDIFVHTDERTANPSETVAVQLDDGRVLCNIRSESQHRRRLVATSPDGATDWSEPRVDDALLEPVCMAGLLKLRTRTSDGHGIYIFTNPDNLENELIAPGGHLAHDRKRLTTRMSADDCVTWTHARVVEEGPAGYSDLAETPDGTVLCLYECGMGEHMTDSLSLTLAKFDLEWLNGT